MRQPNERGYAGDLLRQRSRAALLLMEQHGLSARDVAEGTGLTADLVYKTLQGRSTNAQVLTFLRRRIGRAWNELWENYGRPEAA